VVVAEDLDLDVARPVDVALEDQRVVAERAGGLALGALERGVDLVGRAHDAHALAAAAGRGLDQEREADRQRLAAQGRAVLRVAVVAGHHRHAGGDRPRLGGLLRAEQRDHHGRRADERQAGGGDRLGEAGVLRQEAVAGVDRVGAAGLGRRDDAIDRQVAVAGRRRAEPDGEVGEAEVGRVGVGVGEHRDGAEAHLATGAQHARGDLAAVGDQHAVDRTRDRVGRRVAHREDLNDGRRPTTSCRGPGRCSWPRARSRRRCGCRAGR
jgi:hypothetical protein